MTAAAVPALRTTWRRSTEHFVEQIKRFLRLLVLAALPSVVNLIQGGRFDWRTLLAFVLPFAEVAYREVFPALGAAAADAAPGVTIVPAQVGLAPVPTSIITTTTPTTSGTMTGGNVLTFPAPQPTPADPAPATVDLTTIPQDITP